MPALNDDLADFARTIVRGEQPSPQMGTNYQHYSAAVAIEVYRNNYRGNLQDALAGAYPVIEQLVGNPFFRRMAREFITQHPSRSGNLHHYGAEMADFVAAFEAAQGLPYLPDIAALEWACHCAWFADDAATLDVSGLVQIPPEQYPDLILHTHPSCHLLRSHYPVAAIWHAHQPGANSDFRIDLNSGPCNALVSRKNNTVLVSELTDADAAWLQAIQTATPLGAVTDSIWERYPGFDLQAALLNLVAQEAISDFNLGTTP